MTDLLAAVATSDPDLTACDNEPIHVPGSIQPHGALLVVDPDTLEVLQAAIGAGSAAALASDPVGRLLPDVLGQDAAALLSGVRDRADGSGVQHLGLLRTGDVAHHLIAHRTEGLLIVELERAAGLDPGSFDAVYPQVRSFLDAVQHARTIDDLTAMSAREVRRITGLDRVLVYRFDQDWNGAVIAEDRNETLPSYLGLRFPASDIPAQARELYRLNRLRLIADANYSPTAIEPAVNPKTGQPADLSFAVLRSVSPVHLEYMRNMGTLASMSISLLREGALWGLISCHSREPAWVPFHVRTACDFIAQVMSMQLAAREAAAVAHRRDYLRMVQGRLLAHMASADHYIEGLVSQPADLMNLVGASGAAVVAGETFTLLGDAPEPAGVKQIIDWLGGQRRQDLFYTDSLASLMPDGTDIKDRASGVLAMSISQIHDSYVLWFRPEVVRTVSWGGDPRKALAPDGSSMRIHPRKSFESWQETVRLRSQPWEQAEIDAAAELRTAIVDVVLRKAEETAALSEQLASINKELEAFSYSVSHDLRAPFRHIVGYAQLLKKFEGDRLTDRGNRYIDTIVESAISAGTLVDDLLGFSQMGRITLTPIPIDMSSLVADIRRRLEAGIANRRIEWRIGALAQVRADPMMLRLVWQNLLENALKFTRERDPAVIEIGCDVEDGNVVYHVRDNGAGFDMAYVGKLFGVFQRLHRVEDFEGTGIGLANVKRIVERHGGRTWAEGRVNEGAVFFFSIPKQTGS